MSSNRSVRKKTKAKVYDFLHEKQKKESIATHLTIKEKNKLILSSRKQGRKIACSILRKWNCRLELEEIDSIVDLSLCEAVKHFNPDKGVSFITFLFYHLRGNLIRTINGLANRPSAAMEFNDDSFESGFIGKERINTADLHETFAASNHKGPEEESEDKQLYQIAEKACKSLSDLEREVIFSVYLQEEQVTQIAKDLKYSRCHISRLKTAAVDKLRSEVSRLSDLEVAQNSITEHKRQKVTQIRFQKIDSESKRAVA